MRQDAVHQHAQQLQLISDHVLHRLIVTAQIHTGHAAATDHDAVCNLRIARFADIDGT